MPDSSDCICSGANVESANSPSSRGNLRGEINEATAPPWAPAWLSPNKPSKQSKSKSTSYRSSNGIFKPTTVAVGACRVTDCVTSAAG